MGLTFSAHSSTVVRLLLTLPSHSIHIFIIIIGESRRRKGWRAAARWSNRIARAHRSSREEHGIIVGARSNFFFSPKNCFQLYKRRYRRFTIQSCFILSSVPIWEGRLRAAKWWKWKLARNHLLLFNSSVDSSRVQALNLLVFIE